MEDLTIKNAKIVTRTEKFAGTVHIVDGMIADVDTGNTAVSAAADFDGDYLLPGLIEMHTDNVEKHFVPRPGVMWPSSLGALVAHDTQIAGAGITTVLNAVAVGEFNKSHRRQILGETILAVNDGRRRDLLRADHHLHLRCEIAAPYVVDMLDEHIDSPLVQLVSLMDHTPGQRQWRDMAKFKEYNRLESQTAEEFDCILQERLDQQQKFAATHRREIVRMCDERDIRKASHDDTTVDHVREAIEDGVAISEFPCSVDAAQHARDNGLGIIMGAPNVVRGGSHSGNVSALALAEVKLLDGLSSDYMPTSLLHGAFILSDKLGLSLAEAVATVSCNLSDMLGLTDRGEVAPGKRGDLIRVTKAGEIPVVRGAWRTGQRVV